MFNALPGGIDLGKPLLPRFTVGDGLLGTRLALFDDLAILTKLLKSRLCPFDMRPPFLAAEFRCWLLRDCGTYEGQPCSGRYCRQNVAETLLHHAIHMELPDKQHTRRFIICEQLFKEMLIWLIASILQTKVKWAYADHRGSTPQSFVFNQRTEHF